MSAGTLGDNGGPAAPPDGLGAVLGAGAVDVFVCAPPPRGVDELHAATASTSASDIDRGNFITTPAAA